MSLNDPSRRPWGTARGARIIVTALWGVVGGIAFAAAALWVRMLQGDPAATSPSMVAFNISIFAGIGVLFADLNTAQRRQVEESSSLPRLPGAWFTGAGTGALLASVLGGPEFVLVFWALVMLIGGVAVYGSPNLLAISRARRARHDSRIRSAGASATATVTEVRTLYRNERFLFRPTMTFTDREGRQRWFTRTAPAGIRSVTKRQTFLLHYDPEHPGRRRSMVVGWNTRG
ncbi:hypothetical protein QF046_003112 [Microbacterium sp. W4I4]|uniref:hypothetical protein n=1 Tax=Microbacterium sp. W4I4 TaxID=3042295 RepID=UPI002787E6A1|nr:hypothetical protein [Microbacterium sp. W4I4]MDQ0615471.1 hypothetical protein [Microbacterium sp. W4I4]